jgi:malate dehydrogenase
MNTTVGSQSRAAHVVQQKTTGYLPANDGAKAAFKDADIIVIPAGIPRAYTLY